MRIPLPLFGHSFEGFGMRSFLFLFALLFGQAASAQIEYEYIASVYRYNGVEHSSASAACMAQKAAGAMGGYVFTTAEYGSGVAPSRMFYCNGSLGGNPPVTVTTQYESCPIAAGVTWEVDTVGGTCRRPKTCASKSGESRQMRAGVGYARSSNPNSNDYVPPLSDPSGTDVCDGSCMMSVADTGGANACYRSQVPASNGLHRVSCTFTMTFTGASCSSKSPALDPSVSPPPCPGLVGSVNGNPVCFGTTSAPLPQAPRPDGLPPEGHGNPPAGAPPTSGPGSGEGAGATPPSGDGGAGGGGSNAAIPGGGSGGNGQGSGAPNPLNPDGTPNEAELDLETCGLPGKPACRIDETGTPATGVLDGPANALKAAGDALSAGVAGVDKPNNLGWSFGVSLPVGSCTDFQMYKPGGSWGIGLCDNAYVELIRQLLAWAMGILAAVYCYRSVTRTVSSQG